MDKTPEEALEQIASDALTKGADGAAMRKQLEAMGYELATVQEAADWRRRAFTRDASKPPGSPQRKG